MKKHEAPKRAPWPRLIKIGRTTVKIYRRKMPSGNWAYRIPSYSSGKRRFDCHPVKATQAVKADDVAIQIFTPTEMRKLLGAASGGFLPSIVLGAFAGLRSAEIKRLTWDDIRLAERHIVVGKDKAKTASRRIVPIRESPNPSASYSPLLCATYWKYFGYFSPEERNSFPPLPPLLFWKLFTRSFL